MGMSDEERDYRSMFYGNDRPIIRSSFFETRKWRGWMGCRKPKGVVWDETTRVLALLQRTMGQAHMLKYFQQALILEDESGADDEAKAQARLVLAKAELEAQECMQKSDVRKGIFIQAPAP